MAKEQRKVADKVAEMTFIAKKIQNSATVANHSFLKIESDNISNTGTARNQQIHHTAAPLKKSHSADFLIIL